MIADPFSIALALRLVFVAMDPDVRAPVASPTKEEETQTPPAPDSLPKFGENVHVDQPPEAITKPQPVYPEGAKRQGIQGTVTIQALIGRDGLVKNTRIVSSIPELDAAAESAVRQWTFKPAVDDGKPVAVWAAIPIRFTLHGTPAASPEELLRLAVAEFQKAGPRPPSEQDAIARERIIRMAQSALIPPAPPDSAAQRISAARSLLAAGATQKAIDAIVPGLHAAPWWAQGYREVASALEAAGRRADAAVALDLYLVADPRSPDWEMVRRKLMELRAKK